MDTARRKRRDFLQNIAIVVLTLSAVALFVQTQLYTLDLDDDYFRSLSTSSTAIQPVPTSLADLSAPVRIAVTGDYGHYGSIQMTTTDKAFTESLRSLLRVRWVRPDVCPCSGEEFLDAVSGVSIYYDFLNPPASVFSGRPGGRGIRHRNRPRPSAGSGGPRRGRRAPVPFRRLLLFQLLCGGLRLPAGRHREQL